MADKNHKLVINKQIVQRSADTNLGDLEGGEEVIL